MSDPDLSENRPRHVDRKALYTDLEARIDYLQRFLDFNAGWCPRLPHRAAYDLRGDTLPHQPNPIEDILNSGGCR